MEPSAPAQQSNNQVPAPAKKKLDDQLKNKKNLIMVAVGAVILILLSMVVYTALTRTPERVLSSFIKASQSRKVVQESQFFDTQAEQNFAIVYKIPPKSFKIQKTTIEDKTATVEVDWTMIDSSRDYKERTDTVVFTLRKDGRAWKLDRVKQGDVINFDFLFGN